MNHFSQSAPVSAPCNDVETLRKERDDLLVALQHVYAWHDAEKARVDAVAAYNARVIFVRDHCPFGTSVDAEYQAMEEARHKAHKLLQPMFEAITVARSAAANAARQPELTVWYGAMPESNGKSNFTAILRRKDGSTLEGMTNGHTIARSEYPDRVRYEADRVRYLIGELDKRPHILDYDADKHSGYVPPADRPTATAAGGQDYETQRAIMEGERNAAVEEYIKARPQLDSIHNRRIFEAGFQCGFERRLTACSAGGQP